MRSKDDLRRELAAQRKALPEEAWRARSLRAQATLLASREFQQARTVALYRALGREVDTERLREAAHAQGKRVAYPEVLADDHHLRFVACAPDARWVTHARGFQVPEGEELPASELELIVLPGLGFDRAGNRLGRGAGHYDRSLGLAPQAIRVGLGFDFQLLEALPADPWDVRLHAIATESALIPADRAAGR
jgi:5-formyltetrahydrofolate cyclo-ligase